jgi:signal peptidase I
MEPTLLQGTEVLVSTIPYLLSRPKIGDVIAFRNKADKKIYVKRIAEIRNRTAKTVKALAGSQKKI